MVVSYRICVLSPCRGASQSGNSGDVVVKLEELRQHKEEIEREERELDEQCQRMKQCLKNITDDTYSDEYPLRSLSLLLYISLLSLPPPPLSLSLSLSLPLSLFLSLSFYPSIYLCLWIFSAICICDFSILNFHLAPPLPLLPMTMSANYQHSKVQ